MVLNCEIASQTLYLFSSFLLCDVELFCNTLSFVDAYAFLIQYDGVQYLSTCVLSSCDFSHSVV